MIPDESSECEMIETADVVNADLFSEVTEEGVTLTISADDLDHDIAILLTPAKARQLGDQLFRQGCA